MTIRTEGLEYNILGSVVRVKAHGQENLDALKAIEILQKEIQTVQTTNSKLKDIDVAVLAALKLAAEVTNLRKEYKENVTALRAGVVDALNFIEEVSPGPIRN